MPEFKRKTYSLVDRSHQYRFLAMVLVYTFIIALFLAITLFVPDFMRLNDKSVSFEIRAMTAERVLYLHAKVWPAVLALICLLGLHSFRFVHRFVGPLFRFRWAFDQIRSGNLNFQVKLRKKDLLHREEADFNQMLQVLAVKVGKAQSESGKALQMVDQLLAAKAEGKISEEEIVERLHSVKDRVQALVENVGYFKVQKNPLEESPIKEMIGLSGVGTANTH